MNVTLEKVYCLAKVLGCDIFDLLPKDKPYIEMTQNNVNYKNTPSILLCWRRVNLRVHV